MVDGGMRDRFTIPASLLFSKSGLDLDTLAMIEPLGVGYHAVNRSRISDDDFALVLGAGPIGLAIAQAASARGADVVIADNDADRLELARDLQEAATLDPEAQLGKQLLAHGSGDLPTIVFDATGNVASMERTPDLVSPSGSIVFVGHTTSDLCLHNPTIHVKEVSIHTSRAALPWEWIDLLDLVSKGTLSPAGWIGTRCELADVPSVFPSWIEDRGTIVKAMIEVENSESGQTGGTI
jgi:threonine dehydrogenase-like Zn-dependent dehydrogenase